MTLNPVFFTYFSLPRLLFLPAAHLLPFISAHLFSPLNAAHLFFPHNQAPPRCPPFLLPAALFSPRPQAPLAASAQALLRLLRRVFFAPPSHLHGSTVLGYSHFQRDFLVQASITTHRFNHMGGRGGKKGPNATPGSQSRCSRTLREESNGKKQGSVNVKSMCKLDHLKNLAVWAADEASVPSLGAFFGERLAATSEALSVRPDPSLFICERCESILQPGHNCTVRIEKNKSKVQRRHKKPHLTTQNNVVYKCHFCSHRNLMRGTSKGYVKEICPLKPKPALKLKIAEPAVKKHLSLEKATEIPSNKVDFVDLPPLAGRNLETSFPATPLQTPILSLLDSKRKKRNRSTKKVAESETTIEADNSIHISSKRRKKSWTSLKEIAESSRNDVGNKSINLSIPFFI